jgi:IS30 family transposase
MDYMSGLPSTKRGNDCVFVVVDRFSKMVILVAWKKSITAEATAKLFFEQVWVHFGIPQTIVSDRIVDFSAHSGRASGHYWTPSSPNPRPSTPRQMAKPKL